MPNMFLKVEGITGESIDEDHYGEIEIESWMWDIDNSAAMDQSDSSGAIKLKANDIVVTKFVDLSSVWLMAYCARGTSTTATITCQKNTGGRKLDYLTIELMDCKIKKVQWTGSSKEEPILPEQVTLNFGKFLVNYTEQNNRGGEAVGSSIFGFNISEHKEDSSPGGGGNLSRI